MDETTDKRTQSEIPDPSAIYLGATLINDWIIQSDMSTGQEELENAIAALKAMQSLVDPARSIMISIMIDDAQAQLRDMLDDEDDAAA